MKLLIEWSIEELRQFIWIDTIPKDQIEQKLTIKNFPAEETVEMSGKIVTVWLHEETWAPTKDILPGVKWRIIDIFEKDGFGTFHLVKTAESISEAARYVGAKQAANISWAVESGNVYKDKYKFISKYKK